MVAGAFTHTDTRTLTRTSGAGIPRVREQSCFESSFPEITRVTFGSVRGFGEILISLVSFASVTLLSSDSVSHVREILMGSVTTTLTVTNRDSQSSEIPFNLYLFIYDRRQ